MASALIHSYGRTDRHDKSNRHFFFATTLEHLKLRAITLCLKHGLPQKMSFKILYRVWIWNEILTFIATLSHRVTVLREVTSHRLVDRYQRFEGNRYFHLHEKKLLINLTLQTPSSIPSAIYWHY